MSAVAHYLTEMMRPYLASIGRAGGKAGKCSPAKLASAKKANAARWKNHKKNKLKTP